MQTKTYNRTEGYCVYYIRNGKIILDDNEFNEDKYLVWGSEKELEAYLKEIGKRYKRKYYVGKFKSTITYTLVP